MEHLHSVVDTDTRFKIDPITRQIKNDSHKKIVLVQNDHNSEIFTFECPRTIEGHDMSLCNEVEIHFLNISKKDNKEKSGFYTVKDFKVDPEDESKVVCSWVIDRNATGLVGSLVFLVRYKCKEEEVITYDWHTEIYKEIRISDGINADERFEGDYVDVIDRWKDSVMAHFTAELAAWKARTVVEVKEEAFEEIATERQRIDLLSNYVTPQMFGAKGDGITDDTEAFQAAINNANKMLFVPDGIYLVSELRISKPMKISGASKTNTVLKCIGTGRMLVLKPENIVSSNDFLQVEIENIKIIGDNAKSAIYMNETVHSVINNIHVDGTFENGIEMNGESAIASNYNSIWNNHFEEITIENCKHAFDIMGCISDTHFNLITIMRVDKGVYIHGESDHQGTNNVTFTNSTIIWSKECFEINGCHFRNLHISGCNFEQFDNYGVKIDPVDGDVKNVSIVNSFFMPSTNATTKTICVRLNKVTGGIVNNLLFQNTINGVIGVDTTGSLLLHIDTLSKNNGSTIAHNISNACYYHSYVYENNLDNQTLNVGLKAPRLTTTGGVAFWDGDNRRTLNFVNGNLLTTVDGQNCYMLAYMGTSVIKSLPNVKAGSCIMDGTLEKPVFYTGKKWVDAMGNEI